MTKNKPSDRLSLFAAGLGIKPVQGGGGNWVVNVGPYMFTETEVVHLWSGNKLESFKAGPDLNRRREDIQRRAEESAGVLAALDLWREIFVDGNEFLRGRL
jgi:hypothetical protein